MKERIKIAILDEDYNILKSLNTSMKLKENFEEDMLKLHGLNIKEEAIDLIFKNIISAIENLGLTEE